MERKPAYFPFLLVNFRVSRVVYDMELIATAAGIDWVTEVKDILVDACIYAITLIKDVMLGDGSEPTPHEGVHLHDVVSNVDLIAIKTAAPIY